MNELAKDPKVYEFNTVDDFIVFLNLLIEIAIKHLRRYDKYFKELEQFTFQKLKDASIDLNFIEEFDAEKLLDDKENFIKGIHYKINYWEYKELEDKLFTPQNLLLNVFADRTSNGVSYWRFRKEYSKKAKQDSQFDFNLMEFDESVRAMINDLASARNYEHHLTDAKFIEWRKYREDQLSMFKNPKLIWPTENITIDFNEFLEIGYLIGLYLVSKEFIEYFKKLLQYMKRDYSKLIGKSIKITRQIHREPLTFNYAKISINEIKRHDGQLQ